MYTYTHTDVTLAPTFPDGAREFSHPRENFVNFHIKFNKNH